MQHARTPDARRRLRRARAAMSTHATSLGDDARSLAAALVSAADENMLLDTLGSASPQKLSDSVASWDVYSITLRFHYYIDSRLTPSC